LVEREEVAMGSPRTRLPFGSRWARLGIVALIGLGSGLPTVSALAAPPMQQEIAALPAVTLDYCAEPEEVAFLSILNNYRTQNGLQPLKLSQTLGAAAAAHSVHMANTSYFDHTMSDGTTVVQNVRNHGYAGETYGENIAAGTETADYAFTTFQNSAPHNQNMLLASYESIGIARAYDANSGYGWYWTTIFGGDLDYAADICGEPSNLGLATAGGNGEALDDLNLRSGPGQTFGVLTEVPEGSALNVTGVSEDGYVPVTFSGFTGWVAEEFVLRELTAMQPAAPAPDGAAALDALNLRSGPGPDYGVVAQIPEGSEMVVSGVAEAGYIPVTFSGFTGWVAEQYISLPEPVATTASATQALNLRAGPAVTDAILLVIPAGGQVSLTGASQDGYLGVTYGGSQGWADAAYLAIRDASTATTTTTTGNLAGFSTNQDAPSATGDVGEVMATANLNLRAGAGPGSDILTVVPRGSILLLSGEPESNGYVGVSYNGVSGWVDAAYLG
jgi:uncharacterized protein YraI/uncharacterized protein YkwD